MGGFSGRIWGDRAFTQDEVDEIRAFETGEL